LNGLRLKLVSVFGLFVRIGQLGQVLLEVAKSRGEIVRFEPDQFEHIVDKASHQCGWGYPLFLIHLGLHNNDGYVLYLFFG
jgi:hypothetical protein